ncbi:MAG: hypothetical protein KJZ95_16410 [Caldilinea sp.]|nr:hypothetical protein [Caldilinea sp.]
MQISNKHVIESYSRSAAAEPGKYGIARQNEIQKEGWMFLATPACVMYAG